MGAPDQINPVVLFDGVCNLCNHSVQFIIRRDRGNKFRFAALQSQYGQTQLQKFKLSADSVETIVLIAGDKYFQRSNAVLEIARNLGGLWPALYMFKIIPTFIRDRMYKVVANNRYKWFGRLDQCMIPTPALKALFLD